MLYRLVFLATFLISLPATSLHLKNYGILKGKVVDSQTERDYDTPHYQIRVQAKKTDFRIAVNVRSKLSPPDLRFVVIENFKHPMLRGLTNLAEGFTEIPNTPNGLALDYVRGNLFEEKDLQTMPHTMSGPDNDLNDKLENYISKAIREKATTDIYAFGERWGPENKRDRYFGFKEGNGIHDIHMNQGSTGQFKKFNGAWQDGGLIIHYAKENKFVAIFLAFQSQCFQTNELTGHCEQNKQNNTHTVVTPPHQKEKHNNTISSVKIVGALVNPSGTEQGKEQVILANMLYEEVTIKGWYLEDKLKRQMKLPNITIPYAQTVTITLSGYDVQLSNKGGMIRLLNTQQREVDKVNYTRSSASKEDNIITF